VKIKILKALAPLVVLGVGFAAYAALHATKPAPEKKDDVPHAASLFVAPVKQADITLPVRSQGEVRPRTEIDLVSQVGGRIIWVAPNFVDGGRIAKGEPLIRIEETDFKLAVTRAASRVAEARTQVELKKAATEVARRNWDNSIVGKATPLALKLPQLAEAEAKLRAAQADLEAARLNLQRTRITVPFNGRVRLKQAGIGQFVTAGLKLGRVYSTEVAEVRLPLTDAQMASLGLPIAFEETAANGPEVTLSATIAGARHQWRGRIVRTDAAVDTSTRMLYAVAQVDNPYGSGKVGAMPLAVGLFVDAEVAGQRLDAAYILPRAALRSNARVFVASGDILDIRSVTVAYSDAEKVVLTGGVRPGEMVVVSPVRAPRQGMAITAVAQPARRLADNQ